MPCPPSPPPTHPALTGASNTGYAFLVATFGAGYAVPWGITAWMIQDGDYEVLIEITADELGKTGDGRFAQRFQITRWYVSPNPNSTVPRCSPQPHCNALFTPTPTAL